MQRVFEIFEEILVLVSVGALVYGGRDLDGSAAAGYDGGHRG